MHDATLKASSEIFEHVSEVKQFFAYILELKK